MDFQAIKDLKDRLQVQSTNRDTDKDDRAIAQMAETSGWDVLKASIEKTINKLLEPGIGQESADLETIGAITIAREFTIDTLQAIINTVESTKTAKRVEKVEKAQAEEVASE